MPRFTLGAVDAILLPALPSRYAGDPCPLRERAALVNQVHGDYADVTVVLTTSDARTPEDVSLLNEDAFDVHLNGKFASRTSVGFGNWVGSCRLLEPEKPEAPKPAAPDRSTAQSIPRPELGGPTLAPPAPPLLTPAASPAPPVASPAPTPAATPNAIPPG